MDQRQNRYVMHSWLADAPQMLRMTPRRWFLRRPRVRHASGLQDPYTVVKTDGSLAPSRGHVYGDCRPEAFGVLWPIPGRQGIAVVAAIGMCSMLGMGDLLNAGRTDDLLVVQVILKQRQKYEFVHIEHRQAGSFRSACGHLKTQIQL